MSIETGPQEVDYLIPGSTEELYKRVETIIRKVSSLVEDAGLPDDIKKDAWAAIADAAGAMAKQ